MPSDELHIEMVAAEAARLAIAGWTVDVYGWSHPDVRDGKPLDRATATHIQRQRERGLTARPSTLARLPALAPPAPAEDVPTAPAPRHRRFATRGIARASRAVVIGDGMTSCRQDGEMP